MYAKFKSGTTCSLLSYSWKEGGNSVFKGKIKWPEIWRPYYFFTRYRFWKEVIAVKKYNGY